MKKYWIIPLLLCLLLTGCSRNEDGETTAPTQPMDPPSAQTKTVYVRRESTSQNGDTVTRTRYVFDDANQVCRVLTFTDQVQTQEYTVECDSNGNYILWTSGDSQIRYAYDDGGNLVSYGAYMGETLISATAYTWENGLRTEIRRTVQGAEHRTAMTYDEKGCLIRQDNYANGELTDYSVYTLGADGKPVTQSLYLADGTLSQTISYTYAGSTVKAVSSDGSFSEQSYDEFGNLLSDTQYDAQGNMISRQTHSWMAIEVPLNSLRASI